MLRRILLSLVGVTVGVTPGVIYYEVELTSVRGSLILCALGGFIGLGLTLPWVSARRVIHAASRMTPLLLPLAVIIGPPEDTLTPATPKAPPKPETPARHLPDPEWLTSTVVGLAGVIHDDGAIGLLPILADALEDAGCHDAAVLRHCRESADLTGSSWVVEMLLAGRNDPSASSEPTP